MFIRNFKKLFKSFDGFVAFKNIKTTPVHASGVVTTYSPLPPLRDITAAVKLLNFLYSFLGCFVVHQNRGLLPEIRRTYNAEAPAAPRLRILWGCLPSSACVRNFMKILILKLNICNNKG